MSILFTSERKDASLIQTNIIYINLHLTQVQYIFGTKSNRRNVMPEKFFYVIGRHTHFILHIKLLCFLKAQKFSIIFFTFLRHIMEPYEIMMDLIVNVDKKKSKNQNNMYRRKYLSYDFFFLAFFQSLLIRFMHARKCNEFVNFIVIFLQY